MPDVYNEVVTFPADYKKRKTGTGNGKEPDPHRRTHRAKLETAPFVGWDGEGITDQESGKHYYRLFGNSEDTSVESLSSIDYRDCFPLLLDSQNVINIIYGGDYDIIKMIQSWPIGRRRRLMSGKWTVHGEYCCQWIRRKLFRIKHRPTGRTVTLYDVLPFFQCGFVKACREYLGDSSTLDDMQAMKLQRDSFTGIDSGVRRYWQDELHHLVCLMERFRELLTEVDVVPSKGWYGPGAIANRLMSMHDMRQFYGGVPPEITDIAERAYYGGRFEQFKIGRFEDAYEYDIRSAYPRAISLLPDFSSAEWEYTESSPLSQSPYHEQGIEPFGLYCVSWNLKGSPHTVGPFPWRSPDGRIYFPLQGASSWYWGIEVQAAKQHLGNHLRIESAWLPRWFPIDVAGRPFHWVPEMYDRRAKMRSEGNPAERGLKLGLNSLYGKIAQSVGAIENEGEWRKPPWHHALWAGWITAYTRAMIFGAIAKHKNSLIAIETDAVFVSEELPELTVGEGLGEWEETHLNSILYVRSGIYHAVKDGGVLKLKSRGLEAQYSSNSEDYWLEIFARLPFEEVEITATTRRFGTDLRQPWRFGQWYTQNISFKLPNSYGKRVHLPAECRTCKAPLPTHNGFEVASYAQYPHDLVVPQPFITSDWQPSTPYKFPWRKDARYSWPSFIKSEHIETLGEVQWESRHTL